MKHQFLRHKDTNLIFIATPTLLKMAHMIPVGPGEMDFNPKTGWHYVPKVKETVETPEADSEGLNTAELRQKEIEDMMGPDESDFVIDVHPNNMKTADLPDFIARASARFPEFAIEVPEDAKRPELCRLATVIFKQIKEFAEKNNE